MRTNAGHRYEVGLQQTTQVQWILLEVICYLIKVSVKGSALQRAAQSHDLAWYAESEAITHTREPNHSANRPISLSHPLSIVIPCITRRSMTTQSRNILGSTPPAPSTIFALILSCSVAVNTHWGQGVKYPAGTLRRHGVHRHKVITMSPAIKN